MQITAPMEAPETIAKQQACFPASRQLQRCTRAFTCSHGGRGAVWRKHGAHLKERLWGAIGVMTMHGTLGATIGPPADML